MNLIADSGDSTQENSSSEKEEESTPAPATSSSGPSISLLERIPSDSGAVIMVRVNDILEKGREDIAALLPPELPPDGRQGTRRSINFGTRCFRTPANSYHSK